MLICILFTGRLNLCGNAVIVSSLLAVSYMMDGKQLGNIATSKLITVDFITVVYQ